MSQSIKSDGLPSPAEATKSPQEKNVCEQSERSKTKKPKGEHMLKHIFTQQIATKDLRIFLNIWAAIFGIFLIYPLIKGQDFRAWAAIALAICLALNIAPKIITPLYRIWLVFGEIMGFVISRTLLFVIFFGIFTPIALFFRIIGRDALRQKIDKNAKSYFIERTTQPQSMKNQF